MSHPDVSIIMATWKAAAYVERSIASALASTDVTVEVVAVDDASPDGTFDKLKDLAKQDSRIIVDQLTTNSGPSIARNRAIELCSGRFIAVLDADDSILPDRLSSMIALADETNLDIVFDNMKEVDEQGTPLGSETFLKSPIFANALEIDLKTWVKFNTPLGGTDCLGYLKPVIRKAKLDETGLRYDPVLRNSEDYYLIAHLLAEGARASYTPVASYLYTRSASSTSHRLKPANTRALIDGEERFQAKYRHFASPNENRELEQRKQGLRNLHKLVQTIDAIQQKKIGNLPGLMASDIRSTAFAVNALAKIALGKVIKRKLV